jgi:hypothetical protein
MRALHDPGLVDQVCQVDFATTRPEAMPSRNNDHRIIEQALDVQVMAAGISQLA